MLVHGPDLELGLAIGQFGRLGDLIRAEVYPECVSAYRGGPAGDVAEPTAELHVPIARLQPCIEQERAGSLVMDLADRPEPCMTGFACIQDVVVTVRGMPPVSF